MKISIATSTFSVNSNKPIEIIEKYTNQINFNPYSRILNETELLTLASNADGIIAGNEQYSQTMINNLPNLKVISRLGVGLDNIDNNYAKQKGIKVFKNNITPGPAVAELVIGLMIDISRRISQSDQLMRSGNWKKHMGSLLQGKTLGIIGLGTIGKELVKLTNGFELKILAYDKNEDANFAQNHDIIYCDLKSLLSDSDFISIHLNLSESTKNIIDEQKIELMKPEAILINTSRGQIINENSLYNALKSKKLAGAALDVFVKEPYVGELLELENIVLTPHIGSYAKEIRIKMEIEAAENLIRGLNER